MTMRRVGVGEEKKDSKTECLVREIRILEEENDQLKAENASLQEENNQLKAENVSLQEENGQLKAKVAPVQPGRKAEKAEK